MLPAIQMKASHPHKRGKSLGALLLSVGLLAALTAIPVGSASKSKPPTAQGAPVVVIGIAGGFVRHDNRVHGVVQFAERLRHDFPGGMCVEVFENHRWQQALEEIEKRLDADHDGKLSPEEKRNARIVLYGHSWGASEVVHLAKELGSEGLPVLLTIQVDSVTKPGEDSSLIPANVAEAINFYQQDGWLHGRGEIRAADPARTKILGNIRREYKSSSCPGYPWYNRWFTVPHCAIEIDPEVWDRAEALIRGVLQEPAPAAAELENGTIRAPAPNDR